MNFRDYLLEKKHTESTIFTHLQNLNYFKTWAKNHQIEAVEEAKMRDVLEYVKYLQDHEITVGTINNRLNTLKKYFNYQLEKGSIAKNPIRNLTIKGTEKRVVQNILNKEELNQLYHNYLEYLDAKPIYENRKSLIDFTRSRDKIIIGLMIYQGLHSGELDKLMIDDLDLDKGTIYISSSNKSNSRILSLEPFQLISFYRYTTNLPKNQSKLFDINMLDKSRFMMQEIKGINPRIKTAQQIRASVLINWIKEVGKRKAQYKIGHKQVTTTQNYQIQDTSELSNLLETLHLFG